MIPPITAGQCLLLHYADEETEDEKGYTYADPQFEAKYI